MKQLFKNTYLDSRFFLIIALFVVAYILAYLFPGLFVIVNMLFFVFTGLVCFDLILLFRQSGIDASRNLPEKLSNGDENPIDILVKNKYPFKIALLLID